jgi:hypothetical protein
LHVWEKYNELLTWNKIMKQLAILIISCAPFVKNVAQISSHSFWPNQLILTFLCISTLVNSHTIQITLHSPHRIPRRIPRRLSMHVPILGPLTLGFHNDVHKGHRNQTALLQCILQLAGFCHRNYGPDPAAGIGGEIRKHSSSESIH